MEIFHASTSGLQSIQTALSGIQRFMRSMQAATGSAQNSVVIQNATIGVLNASSVQISQKNAANATSKAQNQQGSAVSDTLQRLSSTVKKITSGASGGAGGGGIPGLSMIGNALETFGPELLAVAEFAAPVVVACKALKEGFDAMNAVAAETARQITEFRQSMITSGGTAAETAQLNGLGRMAGISDMAGLARSLSEKLQDNNVGSAAGANVGIHDYGNALSGPSDKAQNLIKAIDYIMDKSVSYQEAARTARALDLEAFLPLRDLSEQTKANFKETERLAAAAQTPELQRQTAEYNAALARVGMEFDTFKLKLGERFLPIVTSLIDSGANALHRLTDLFDRLSAWWDRLMGAPHKALQEQQDAIKDHSAAMRDHAQALRSGIYGGGQRARGAMPSAWGGANSPNWTGQTANLGAFAL